MVALVVLPSVGCSGSPDTSGPSPTTTASQSSAPSANPSPTQTETVEPTESPLPSPGSCAPFGSTAEAASADPLALSTLTGDSMRVGRHDCYERFVFEMAGTGGDPGWRVRYQDPLTGQGSGEPIPLRGDADLEILIGAMTVTDFDGRPEEWPPFTGPDDIVTTGFVALLEARMLYGFEGTTQIGLGVDAQRPFRVRLLDDPPRLVVDIYTGEPVP